MTDPIARIKDLAAPYGAGISYADLSREEQRLVRIGAACAAILLWFAVALVQPWLMVAVPLLAAAFLWFIRRRRLNRPQTDDVEDWF